MFRVSTILCVGLALQSAGCRSLFLSPSSDEKQLRPAEAPPIPPIELVEPTHTEPTMPKAIPAEPPPAEISATPQFSLPEPPQESLTTKLIHLPRKTAAALVQLPEKTATAVVQLPRKTATALAEFSEKTATKLAQLPVTAVEAVRLSDEWRERNEAASIAIDAVVGTVAVGIVVAGMFYRGGGGALAGATPSQ